MADQTAPFQQLDFLYTPSRDVATDLVYFTEVLGGRVVFAVEAMGTRVAAVQFTTGPPLVLLADHVEGERPILVYRVADLAPPWPGLRRGAGSGSGPWRSLTGRAARFKRRAATGSPCTS
jgi:hypothetical protein